VIDVIHLSAMGVAEIAESTNLKGGPHPFVYIVYLPDFIAFTCHMESFLKILIGIGGKVYDIIHGIYKGNKNKITQLFSQDRGVRQGFNIRPTLFNIYIN
jgi:hypothetical protein